MRKNQDLLLSMGYYPSSQFIMNSCQDNEGELNEVFNLEHTQTFEELTSFIDTPSNKPALLTSPANSGKKTLLCQLMRQQSKKFKNKVCIASFSAVSNVYSEILYEIMIKLRTTFEIDQKVEVNEEKIRRYFKYWLEVTSDKIEKENIGYTHNEKTSVLIVIDGIDQVVNSKGQSVFPSFWLPKEIPKNIKLVLSGDQSNSSIGLFLKENQPHLIQSDFSVTLQKIKYRLTPEIKKIIGERPTLLIEIKCIENFIKKLPSINLESGHSFEKILTLYITEQSKISNLKTSEIHSLLLCLSLSKKGLTARQLGKINKLKPSAISCFLSQFQCMICQHQQYFLIANSHSKSTIFSICDPNNQKKKEYHEIIAKGLKKEQCSIRKLQEEIYHLAEAEKYFQIKELITQIENFLVLYSPPCKYLLCISWKKIEQALHSDPVFEYNKTVENFLTHYHPKQEQIFKIIYQLSMFFREYSEFEGARVPQFRHPLIRSGEEQLQKTNVYEELKHLKMLDTEKVASGKLKQTEDIVKRNSPTKAQSKKMSQSKPKQKTSSKTNDKKLACELELAESSKTITEDNMNELGVENLQSFNLQIPSNREKFREYYLDILKVYLKEYFLPNKKQIKDRFLKTESNELEEEEEQISETELLRAIDFQKEKKGLILKNFGEFLEENQHREEVTKFYYYKEWLWMQFPWICQSLSSNFSEMIKASVGSSTSYMSIHQELHFFEEVLEISKISKHNKSAIYQTKQIELHSIGRKQSRFSRQNSTVTINRRELNDGSPSRMTLKETQVNRSTVIPDINAGQNLSLAKYSLNMSCLENKIGVELQNELTARKMYDSRLLRKSQTTECDYGLSKVPQNSAFLTESNKENASRLLPSLKQSRFISSEKNPSKLDKMSRIKVHENKVLEKHDLKQKKSLLELNCLINSNKALKQKIEELEKTCLMMDNIDEVSPVQELSKKNEELQQKKLKLQKKMKIQEKFKSKLQVIIKICDNNQSHERQSTVLSNFLQNLKAMTNFQNTETQSITKELKAEIELFKKQYKKFKNTKEELINGEIVVKAKKKQKAVKEADKVQIQKGIERSPKKLEQSKIDTKKIESNHSRKNKTYFRPRTMKNKSIAFEKVTELWQDIEDLFEIDSQKCDYGSEQISKTVHQRLEEFQSKFVDFKALSFSYEELYYQNEQQKSDLKDIQQAIENARKKAPPKGNKSLQSDKQGSLQSSEDQSLCRLQDLQKRKQVLIECLSL